MDGGRELRLRGGHAACAGRDDAGEQPTAAAAPGGRSHGSPLGPPERQRRAGGARLGGRRMDAEGCYGSPGISCAGVAHTPTAHRPCRPMHAERPKSIKLDKCKHHQISLNTSLKCLARVGGALLVLCARAMSCPPRAGRAGHHACRQARTGTKKKK